MSKKLTPEGFFWFSLPLMGMYDWRLCLHVLRWLDKRRRDDELVGACTLSWTTYGHRGREAVLSRWETRFLFRSTHLKCVCNMCQRSGNTARLCSPDMSESSH